MRGPRLAAIPVSPSPFASSFTAVRRRHCFPPPAVRGPRGFDGGTNKYWDKFYKRHQNKFFKDRHYLDKDWGKYFSDDSSASSNGKVVLESNVNFNEDQVNAFLCDVVTDDLCDTMMPSSIDVVTLIFMLSAVCPKKMHLILQNVKKVLKPDGHILLRDYAIGDYAQVELDKRNQMISENFYIRGDGTSAFYFSEEFLSALFGGAGFTIVDMDIYGRQIQNRSQNITMSRRWIRATFSQFACVAPQ
ncbi:uncharacterized protein LOC131310166 isoform X7 [Rhododendron vialii]|uniref:uncharacterized protein LOC131310166 isoform X7 n=1 Tax=Rhododendron vialii TaxID=182163 RepID=UPI00265FA1A7|nr:uncharacterized protein LOC131310166 isoform X7 [Rhododendron vialii]